MLSLHETHEVAGGRMAEFEDAIRTRWQPLVEERAEARLCWFWELTHGTGASYQAVSITAVRDYEGYCDGVAVAEEGENVTVEELKARIDRQADFVLVDVREPSEHQICQIPGAQLIPLGELAERYVELPRDREVVVHCRSGVRSARAVHFLKRKGFEDVHNLEGGILAWIERIDPSQRRY